MHDIFKAIKNVFDLKLEYLFYLHSKKSSEGLDSSGVILLNSIKSEGSIASAASKIGIDYKKAWLIINNLEKNLGFKVLDKTLGGYGGGAGRLTLEGEILLQKYLLVNKKTNYFTTTHNFLKPDLIIMGSDCEGVVLLAKKMEQKYDDFYVEHISVGSSYGLDLVLKKLSDVAGVHLFSNDSEENNDFLLKDPHIGKRIALIKGYFRTQGIIIKKGNPKKIVSIKDILRNDVVFVNRNQGSGTRYFTDKMLQELANKEKISLNNLLKRVRGYRTEVWSHQNVAASLKQGKADVGIGIKGIAKAFNLDFIPLRRERFDFVTLINSIEKVKIKRLIETISSREFKSVLTNSVYSLEPSKEMGRVLSQ